VKGALPGDQEHAALQLATPSKTMVKLSSTKAAAAEIFSDTPRN